MTKFYSSQNCYKTYIKPAKRKLINFQNGLAGNSPVENTGATKLWRKLKLLRNPAETDGLW